MDRPLPNWLVVIGTIGCLLFAYRVCSGTGPGDPIHLPLPAERP